MISFKEKVLRVLFPPRCICCDELVDINMEYPHICEKCIDKVKISPVRVCSKCGKPMDLNAYAPYCKYCAGEKVRFKYLISPLTYNEVGSDIVKKYKYNSRTEIAKSLAVLLWNREKEYNLQTDFDVIIPAPSGKTKSLKLRTEHMKDLCRELSCLSGIPSEELLFKQKGIASQNSLSAKARKTNLKGKITYTGGAFNRVLLVDDVYTTGSTIDESCLMLKKAGCKEIYVLVVAVNINEEFE